MAAGTHATPPARRRSAEDAVELKAGQTVLVSTAPDAKFSRECIPLSISSFQGCNLKPGSEIFVGQYLFAGAPHALIREWGGACMTVAGGDTRFSLAVIQTAGVRSWSAHHVRGVTLTPALCPPGSESSSAYLTAEQVRPPDLQL